jgi:hypothetical protein
MSKEQQELLDEAYENYCKITPSEQVIGSDLNPLKNSMTWKRKTDYSSGYPIYERLTKEEFINKIKTDDEFAKKWGLSIQERELSWEERRDLLTPEQYDGTALNKYGHKDCGFGDISPFTDKVIHYWMNLHNIPTKLITISYNDQTIESYE